MVTCGLFETMRSFGGRVFALDLHIARLMRSCPVVGLKPPSKNALEKAVTGFIRKNHLKDAVLRLSVVKQAKGASIFVLSRKVSLPEAGKYADGFSLVLYKGRAQGPSPLNNVKSLDHGFYTKLTAWARRKGFDEALFLNTRGQLVEGSRTNVFFVKGGNIITPAVSCGCLPGITRQIVIKLFKKQNITVKEAIVSFAGIRRSDEIFVTNSLIGVMPVTRLDGRKVGNGAVGGLASQAMSMYEKAVEKECFLR